MNISPETQLCIIDRGECGSFEELLGKLIHSPRPLSKSDWRKWQKVFGPKLWSKKFFHKDEVISLPLDLINFHQIYPQYFSPSLNFQPSLRPRVLEENQYCVVLYKPPMCHTHPLRYCEADNMLSYLREIGRHDLLRVNERNFDRGFLHRLDFETSGILIYCKSEEVYGALRNDFQNSMKEKIYQAHVKGKFPESLILKNIIHYLKPSGQHGHKIQAITEEERGLLKNSRSRDEYIKAELTIERCEYDSVHDKSCLTVKLGQGHRHQIRVQLQRLGFPIIGDPLYGDPLYGDPLYGDGFQTRMLLQSENYQFIYLEKTYDFKLPPDLSL